MLYIFTSTSGSNTEEPVVDTEVGTKSPGRQDSCPELSDNSLEGCPDNALESASELRLFPPNMGRDTRITPERCLKIPSTRSQEKFQGRLPNVGLKLLPALSRIFAGRRDFCAKLSDNATIGGLPR